jgi:gamma-glutamyltranspeptidase/glutathione hydrolase
MHRPAPNKRSLIRTTLACTLLTLGHAPVIGADEHPRFPNSVTGTYHMVSSAHPVASQAGIDILNEGGTAMDAAVAVQLMLNLVEPESSGIGGGAFMLYWDHSEKKLLTYDGREKAPASATPAYFLKDDGEPMKWPDAVPGGLSVGVPGTLRLLEVAHAEHGIRPWPELFTPAITLAESGFEITDKLAGSIERAKERGLTLFEPTRNYFFNEDGSGRAAGTTLTNPAFASTLKLLAAEGSAPFYSGALAEEIVATVTGASTNPGQMTLADLNAYEVVQREPVCFPYREHEVCGMGPPTSGGLTMGQILGILSHYDLPSIGPGVESWHLFIEAAKLAYADRGMYMADADFVDMPEGLLNKDYLSERAALIDPQQTMGSAEAGTPPWQEAQLRAPDLQPEKAGTSHFSIIDRYGNMVSMTTTIETGFGSRLMVGGFLLNNELTDFSFRPEKDGKPVANRVEGNKRPRSSMSPTIVLKDGRPVLLTGSPGGSRIINYVTQSVVAILDWGMDPQDALNMGHVVNRNSKTDLEEGSEAVELQGALEALGHEVNVRALTSGLHTILIDGARYYGAADPRRSGVAIGE